MLIRWQCYCFTTDGAIETQQDRPGSQQFGRLKELRMYQLFLFWYDCTKTAARKDTSIFALVTTELQARNHQQLLLLRESTQIFLYAINRELMNRDTE